MHKLLLHTPTSSSVLESGHLSNLEAFEGVILSMWPAIVAHVVTCSSAWLGHGPSPPDTSLVQEETVGWLMYAFGWLMYVQQLPCRHQGCSFPGSWWC
jgi:hypothetical protein